MFFGLIYLFGLFIYLFIYEGRIQLPGRNSAAVSDRLWLRRDTDVSLAPTPEAASATGMWMSAWLEPARLRPTNDRVKQAGGKVLVHCEAGISRSPTICMAYLMRSRRLRLEEAFDVIRKQRAIISPNFSFMGQLLQFEAEVLSTPPPASPSSSVPEASMDSAASAEFGGNGTGPVPALREPASLPRLSIDSASLAGTAEVSGAGTKPPPTPGPRGLAGPSPFFSDDFELGKSWEEPSSVFSFPTSFLSPLPLQSPVRQFKLSPITALP